MSRSEKNHLNISRIHILSWITTKNLISCCQSHVLTPTEKKSSEFFHNLNYRVTDKQTKAGNMTSS